MCNDDGNNGTTFQDVVAGRADVKQNVQDAINTMVGVDRLFTAWDVTVLARQNTGKVLGNHTGVLKHIIHELMEPLPDDYEKTLITLTSGEQAFLYHPIDKLPSDYHLCDDFQDVDDNIQDNIISIPQKTVRKSTRISVPKGLLTQVGLKSGDNAYLSLIAGSESGLEIFTQRAIVEQTSAKINEEGRLRLRVSQLKDYGLVGDEFDISLGLNGKSITIKNIKDA